MFIVYLKDPLLITLKKQKKNFCVYASVCVYECFFECNEKPTQRLLLHVQFVQVLLLTLSFGVSTFDVCKPFIHLPKDRVDPYQLQCAMKNNDFKLNKMSYSCYYSSTSSKQTNQQQKKQEFIYLPV